MCNFYLDSACCCQELLVLPSISAGLPLPDLLCKARTNQSYTFDDIPHGCMRPMQFGNTLLKAPRTDDNDDLLAGPRLQRNRPSASGDLHCPCHPRNEVLPPAGKREEHPQNDGRSENGLPNGALLLAGGGGVTRTCWVRPEAHPVRHSASHSSQLNLCPPPSSVPSKLN